MAGKKVGDFLSNMVDPGVASPVGLIPTVSPVGGVAPINAEVIKEAAGAPDLLEPSPPGIVNIDPMLVKELEINQLRLQLVESEEALLIAKVQEARRKRLELVKIQRGLVARVQGQQRLLPDPPPQTIPAQG